MDLSRSHARPCILTILEYIHCKGVPYSFSYPSIWVSWAALMLVMLKDYIIFFG